jgi:Right handed beta helix region
MGRRALVLTAAGALALLMLDASAFGSGRAATVRCGDVITESVTLTKNLYCPGGALTIGADDVVLDLNGHVVFGDGTGDGISVGQPPLGSFEFRGVARAVVRNGKVRNFDVGVRIQTASTHTRVDDLTITNNTSFGVTTGSEDTSLSLNDHTSVVGSRIHDNFGGGVRIGFGEKQFAAPYADVSGNEVYSNGSAGIQLYGYSDSSTIAGNHVYWNGDDGIMSSDSITAITNNLVTDNAGTGIYVTSYDAQTFGPSYWIADNTSKRNGRYGIYMTAGIRDGGGNVARRNAFEPQICVATSTGCQ